MSSQPKSVLITGGSKRIGREIALALAKAGCSIILHYNRSAKEAKSLQKKIQTLRVDVALVQQNFSQPNSEKTVQAFLKKLKAKKLTVDILINNASLYYATPLQKIKERDWDEMMTVNLKVPVLLMKALGEQMKKRGGGKIINFTDAIMDRSRPDYLPYRISKKGLQAATEDFAKQLAPNVQVNSIAPGPILPPVGVSPQRKKEIVKSTLLKRYGDPQDIVKAVHYLLEADYLTGSCQVVDGGSRISN